MNKNSQADRHRVFRDIVNAFRFDMHSLRDDDVKIIAIIELITTWAGPESDYWDAALLLQAAEALSFEVSRACSKGPAIIDMKALQDALISSVKVARMVARLAGFTARVGDGGVIWQDDGPVVPKGERQAARLVTVPADMLARHFSALADELRPNLAPPPPKPRQVRLKIRG